MKTDVISVRYRDGAFVPLTPNLTAKKFTDGEIYFFRHDKKRYWPRHQWFMCLMRDAWESLPEEYKEQFPTPDILRKRLLIAAGYNKVRSLVCGSEAEARRVITFIAPSIDDYTVCSVQGSVAVIATAKSQAMNSMDEDEFRRSVEDVQDHLAIMLGCSKDDIRLHQWAPNHTDLKEEKR